MKILCADDDRDLLALIAFTLSQAGYLVISAGDGTSAIRSFESELPDLVILDINMPGASGFQVCEAIRAQSRVPVMMLTVRGEEEDLVRALDLGADDYLTKPFSPKELVARVRAVLRRTDAAGLAPAVMVVGDLTIDIPRHEVRRGPVVIDLTSTEFDLLAALGRQPGRVFTRGQMLEAIRGVSFPSYERAIDAHVKNLRRKLEPDPRRPRYLITVHGVGYKLADV